MNVLMTVEAGDAFVNRKTKSDILTVITVSYAYTHTHTVPVVVVQVYHYKSLMIQIDFQSQVLGKRDMGIGGFRAMSLPGHITIRAVKPRARARASAI